MSDFWFYPFPMLVLIAMVAWNDLSTRIQLCKLEERIRELEQGKEGE
jgi:hypothetical protein